MGENDKASVLFYHNSMEKLAKSIAEHCQVGCLKNIDCSSSRTGQVLILLWYITDLTMLIIFFLRGKPSS